MGIIIENGFNVILNNTIGVTPTPTPTPTPTFINPLSLTLNISFYTTGILAIIFDGVTYTEDTTINVISGQTYNIAAVEQPNYQFVQWGYTPGSAVLANYQNQITTIQIYNSNQNLDASFSLIPTPTTTPTSTTTVTPTPSITPTTTVTVTPTNTVTPTSSVTPTFTPTPSITPTITPTNSAGVTFSQTFTLNTAPGTTIENAWTTFRAALTGTYTTFSFTSSLVGSTAYVVTDAVKVQALATNLKNGTATSQVINSVTWLVGCCACRAGGTNPNAIEFSNVGSCSGSSTAALRPWIANANWGGIGSTVGAATQTLTLTFS